MKQGLSLRVSQHLALTPQLQQSIRLLQLSTLELSQEVDQMLDENPFLERSEEEAPMEAFGLDQTDTRVRSRGNVRISSAGNQFAGPELELRLDTFEGFFTQPRFRFLSGGNGQASRVDFIDSKHAIIQNASYSTCQRRPGPSRTRVSKSQPIMWIRCRARSIACCIKVK